MFSAKFEQNLQENRMGVSNLAQYAAQTLKDKILRRLDEKGLRNLMGAMDKTRLLVQDQ